MTLAVVEVPDLRCRIGQNIIVDTGFFNFVIIVEEYLDWIANYSKNEASEEHEYMQTTDELLAGLTEGDCHMRFIIS